MPLFKTVKFEVKNLILVWTCFDLESNSSLTLFSMSYSLARNIILHVYLWIRVESTAEILNSLLFVIHISFTGSWLYCCQDLWPRSAEDRILPSRDSYFIESRYMNVVGMWRKTLEDLGKGNNSQELFSVYRKQLVSVTRKCFLN